jgi:hypothetical protein
MNPDQGPSNGFSRAIRSALESDGQQLDSDARRPWNQIAQLGEQRLARRRHVHTTGLLMVVTLFVIAAVTFFVTTDNDNQPTSRPAFGTLSSDPQVTPIKDSPGCYTVQISNEVATGCLSAPGVSGWRIGGLDYLASTGDIPLTNGSRIAVPQGQAAVVVPLSKYEQEVHSCITGPLAESIAAEEDADKPYVVPSCSPYVAFVASEAGPLAPGDLTDVYERSGDGSWHKAATVDFRITDKSARCAELSNAAPGPGATSPREMCLLLG